MGWQRGLTRIDGFERFDGQISSSATDYWIVTLPTVDVTGTPANAVTDLVWTFEGDTGPSGVLVEYIDTAGSSKFAVVFRQGRIRPVWGSVIADEAGSWSFLLDELTVTVVTLSGSETTHSSFLDTLSTYTEKLRAEVKLVPGGGTIVGLHHHEDALYAVRDVARIAVTAGEENKLLVGMYVYNAAGQVGEVVRADAAANEFHIAAVDNDGFTLAAGDSISIALTVRFENGSGSFTKLDNVEDDVSVLLPLFAWTGTVGFIERRDGSFDSGNAIGLVAFINGPDDPPILSATLNNTTTTGSMRLESALFKGEVNATTVATAFSKADVAALWRSTDDGWEAATAGRVLAFENGVQDPTSDALVPQTITRTPAVAVQSSSTSDPDWIDPANIIVEDGFVAQVAVAGYTPLAIPGYSDRLEFTDFGFGVLNDVTITGIGVTLKGYEGFVGGSNEQRVTLHSSGVAGYTRTGVLPEVANPGVDVEIGGINSLWSAQGHTPAEVNAASFGFRLQVKTFFQTTTAIDVAKVTIYFTSVPGATLYLWDGSSDIGTIAVKQAVVTSGDWGGAIPDPGLAEGYFRLSDWSVVNLPSGVSVYSMVGGAGGGGFKVADIVGSVDRPVLPGSRLLEVEHSKYQMISYNFFASEDRNAIYGVNGAGQAFWYDGGTLDFIPTGVGIEVDKPRHIAPHENRLLLGYKWGEAYLSGPDPLDFDAATGLSTSFGFGDKITGLMPAAGKATAVFTESQVHVLLGAPQGFSEAALETVDQQVVNHKIGAIEYTVQNIGNRPIFASFRGIETMETMDQYSDFFTAPLTYNVSPWLLERLQTAAGVETTDKSVVNSVVIRNKNQYRLFFADGYVLTLTHVGPEKDPQSTTQKYWFSSDETKYLRCFATASGVTTNGRDRAFISAEARPGTLGATGRVTGTELGYVYELDRGRSFDGGLIDYNFTLTHYYSVDQQGAPYPQSGKRFNVFHLHGEVPGWASIYVARSVNYEDLDDPVLPYEEVNFGAASMPPEDKQKPKYTKGRLNARGFAVSVHIKGSTSKEFPHIIQMISFLNDTAVRPDR